MSSETFVFSDVKAGKPRIVSHIDDAIFNLDPLQKTSDFLEINGYRAGLVRSINIQEKEDADLKYEDVNKRGEEIRQQQENLRQKQIARENKDDHLLLMNFLQYALDNWMNTGEEILQSSSNRFTVRTDTSRFSLNTGEKSSVLTRTLAKSTSLLLICDTCFRLIERSGLSPNGERVQLHNKNYWPEFLCSAKEFNHKYSQEIEIAFKKKLDEFYKKETAELKNQTRIEKDVAANLKAKQKENSTLNIGWVKLENSYYLYQHRRTDENKGYFQIWHTGSQKFYGWFPPCTVGLKICAKDSELFYVLHPRYKNIRILRPKPYIHPAILNEKNPHLCTKGYKPDGSLYSYPGENEKFTWDSRKKFLLAIKDSITDALRKIETGLQEDRGESAKSGQTAPTYSSIWKDFPEYEDCKMPIGWADDKLTWDMQ
ncbi:hypothetical protein KY333_03225 [Candidatus Woesearchaeota archaeon]|nr:hypothetical protein [Candidatus Woesearchaeota archaeon]